MNFKDRLCAMNCHYRFYELENFFQSVHKLGMHYVELWSGPMHYYVDARRHDSPEQLKKLCGSLSDNHHRHLSGTDKPKAEQYRSQAEASSGRGTQLLPADD